MTDYMYWAMMREIIKLHHIHLAEYDIITDTDIEPSHFFPGSLSPIGSHRVIDAVVCADRDGCLLEVHGEHGLAPQDVLDEMPSYYEMIQTVSVRIPYTKTPHGGSS